jgi:hypothetical protein
VRRASPPQDLKAGLGVHSSSTGAYSDLTIPERHAILPRTHSVKCNGGTLIRVLEALAELRRELQGELEGLAEKRLGLERELEAVDTGIESKHRMMELVEATEEQLAAQGSDQPGIGRARR